MSVVESAVERSQTALCHWWGVGHRAIPGLQVPGAAGTSRASGADDPSRMGAIGGLHAEEQQVGSMSESRDSGFSLSLFIVVKYPYDKPDLFGHL